MSIAAEIRAELARQNIPACRISETLGFSKQSLSGRLGTERKDFRVGELEKIGDFLGVPGWELMRRSAENEARA